MHPKLFAEYIPLWYILVTLGLRRIQWYPTLGPSPGFFFHRIAGNSSKWICRNLELFSFLLSYFHKNAWVILVKSAWIILLHKTWWFWAKWAVFCKNYPNISPNSDKIGYIIQEFVQFLSYFPYNLSRICRKLEFFPQSAWVIFKTLSYFTT